MFLNFLISCRSPELCCFLFFSQIWGCFTNKYDSCGKPVNLRGWAGFLVPRHTCGAYAQLPSRHPGTTAQEVGNSATGCGLIYHWQRRSNSHENMHIKRMYVCIHIHSIPFHSIPFHIYMYKQSIYRWFIIALLTDWMVFASHKKPIDYRWFIAQCNPDNHIFYGLYRPSQYVGVLLLLCYKVVPPSYKLVYNPH